VIGDAAQSESEPIDPLGVMSFGAVGLIHSGCPRLSTEPNPTMRQIKRFRKVD
jgi:hypothetical protein